MIRLVIWWHRRRGHTVTIRRVTPPAFTPWVRGELIDCSCGKGWAQ